MKKLLAMLMLAFVCAFAAEEKLNWNPDFNAAQKTAAANNKLLFVLFTGSDWCPWCVKLDEEILSKPKVTEYLNKHFVLYKADFPCGKKLSPETVQTNETLHQKYRMVVRGYPTILILNSNGKVIGETGYLSKGPDDMIRTLEKIQKSVK